MGRGTSTPSLDKGEEEMTSILLIPDAHATPDHHNDRFKLIGNLAVERQPEYIVCIGDFADMPSLSTYDKGTKKFEGRRYKKDIAATLDAQEKMFAPIIEYNKKQKANHKSRYKPKLIMTIGNHENRINRAANAQAELDGVISIDDLGYKKFGWKVYPFLEPVIVEGIAFQHYFTSGVMGRPIGGKNQASRLLTEQHMSCIQGHTHTRDMAEQITASGKRITGLVCGCYLDVDQYEDYAGPANAMWWKGLVMLNDVNGGEYEPEWINVKQLYNKYM